MKDLFPSMIPKSGFCHYLGLIGDIDENLAKFRVLYDFKIFIKTCIHLNKKFKHVDKKI